NPSMGVIMSLRGRGAKVVASSCAIHEGIGGGLRFGIARSACERRASPWITPAPRGPERVLVRALPIHARVCKFSELVAFFACPTSAPSSRRAALRECLARAFYRRVDARNGVWTPHRAGLSPHKG